MSVSRSQNSDSESRLWRDLCSSHEAGPVGAGLRPMGTLSSTLSTALFAGVHDYHPEDLVVTVGAGTRLSELNQRLVEQRQWLPIVPFDGGDDTVGGLLAVGLGSWLSHAYGPLRDRVLGLRVVTPAFGPIFVGSRVVKSVAGYNLVRVMVGTRGALGVITEAVLKVSPRETLYAWTHPLGPDETAQAVGRPFEEVTANWTARGVFRQNGHDFAYAIWDGSPELADPLIHHLGPPDGEAAPILSPPSHAILAEGAVPPRSVEAIWHFGLDCDVFQVEFQTGHFFMSLGDIRSWRALAQTVRQLSGSLKVLRGFSEPDLAPRSDPLWARLKEEFDPNRCLSDWKEVPS